MTDEFIGVGGSYIADPVTGKRTLIERTGDPIVTPIVALPVEEQEEQGETTTSKKRNKL